MFARPVLLAIAVVMLLPAACRKADIASYRIPKEKDPEFPAASSLGAAATNAPLTPPGGAMASTPVTTADGPGLSWTAPASWKLKPAAPMRKATYAVPGDGGEAELSITAFPNDVGGEIANFNRWRGQVHLPPLPETEYGSLVTRFTANGLSFAVADFANAQASASSPQHILGAIVPFEGATWFFKLTGSDPVVANTKAAFLEFLKSVKATATALAPAPAAP
jgi:hypothetical protein